MNNKIYTYKHDNHGFKCSVQLNDTEYIFPVQTWNNIAREIITKTEPHLTSTMHTDSEFRCPHCGPVLASESEGGYRTVCKKCHDKWADWANRALLEGKK